MRRWFPWLVALVLGAAAVHVAVVHAVPWVIMRIAMRGIGAAAGVNVAAFPPRADENARAIVRPSPDLLYSTCTFDVSAQPLRLTAEVPADTYWSISMFAANTDNFFKLNDREAEGGRVDLVLARQGERVALPPGARRVDAPTARGVILTRTLIAEESRFEELDRARRAFKCEAFSDAEATEAQRHGGIVQE